MATSIWSKIDNTYFLACTAATIGLQLYCITRYFKNDDITEVKYTSFHSSKDAIYPSFSICILPPFIEKRFDEYGNGINMASYGNFLKGQLWDERMVDVDYDNVSTSISDNLLGTSLMPLEASELLTPEPDYFVSFRSGWRKCFTINMPFLYQKRVYKFRTFLKNDIFPQGKRPDNGHWTNGFFWYVHYPKQRFTGIHTIKYDWPLRTNKSKNYLMKFIVKDIEVVTRRNKSPEPCVEDWMNYDQHMMEKMMTEAGCRPPHWSPYSNLPICSNATQMKRFASQPRSFVHPPCKNIERVDYVYEEIDEREFANEQHHTIIDDLETLGG